MIGARIKINLIAFLVISIGLIYGMANQVLSVLKDRISVEAIFPDAGGVFTNQEVTYRGITVGQVGEMKVIEDGVSIELLIDEEYKVPSEGVEARVMFKSAVGEQFVDLLPASDTEPYLEDGDEIPIEQTSIPVSTQALLSTLEAVLRGVPPEDLKGAVDALGIGLTGRGPDLATIIESTADLATLFAERAPEVQGLLRNGTEVGGAFIRSRRDFAEAIHQLVTVSESLADSTPEIERLMRGANLTSEELVRLLRENKPAVDEFLREFGEVNAIQAQHSDDLRQILQFLPSALGNITKAFEPTTGLIRFGLVNDSENHACDYGTPRRRPSERERRLPPKNAHCGGATGSEERSAPSDGTGTGRADIGSMDGLGGDGPSLPGRMSDWSWTLFYLNAI